MESYLNERFVLPYYNTEIRHEYDDLSFEERKKVMDEIGYPEKWAVYSYMELSNLMQKAINTHFHGRGLGEVKQDPDIKNKPGTQPAKYYKGLSKTTKTAREKQFKKQTKMSDDNPAAYKKAPGDTAKTKPSKYTKKFKEKFGEVLKEAFYMGYNNAKQDLNEESKVDKALKSKAKKSNAPLSALRAIYNKGVAAWRTGHRPGAGKEQWGLARVNSVLTGGKARKVDAAQWKQIQKYRKRKKKK